MTLTCPRCEQTATDSPSTEVTCESCNHTWLRPLPIPLAYLIRRVDGAEPIGPYTRSEVRQMLYTRDLTGREQVRVPGHDVPWAPLYSQPSFQDIIQLLDIQVQSSGRIQGWQKTAPSSSAPSSSAPSSSAPSSPAPSSPAPSSSGSPSSGRSVSVQAVPERGIRAPVLVGGAILVAVVVLLGVLALNLF